MMKKLGTLIDRNVDLSSVMRLPIKEDDVERREGEISLYSLNCMAYRISFISSYYT